MAEFDVKTITVGTAINTSRNAILYADQHPDTWASVGYHPEHVTSEHEDEDEIGSKDEPFDINIMEELVKSSPRVLAIGECGLDYHRINEDCSDVEKGKADQQKVFQDQIDLAAKLDKALIVHMRDAEEDMLNMIKKARTDHPNLRITMHSFTSTWKQAQALLDLECFLGIGGIVTFKPRKTTEQEDILSSIVKNMPLDKILVETDCPWLAPVPVRGERNEPTHVRHTAQFIADIKGITYEEICKITTENAQKCFKCEFK